MSFVPSAWDSADKDALELELDRSLASISISPEAAETAIEILDLAVMAETHAEQSRNGGYWEFGSQNYNIIAAAAAMKAIRDGAFFRRVSCALMGWTISPNSPSEVCLARQLDVEGGSALSWFKSSQVQLHEGEDKLTAYLLSALDAGAQDVARRVWAGTPERHRHAFALKLLIQYGWDNGPENRIKDYLEIGIAPGQFAQCLHQAIENMHFSGKDPKTSVEMILRPLFRNVSMESRGDLLVCARPMAGQITPVLQAAIDDAFDQMRSSVQISKKVARTEPSVPTFAAP